MNQRLQHYRVAVQHPEVSGFEHLGPRGFPTPSARCTAEKESRLSPEEKQQLTLADQRLLEQAAPFTPNWCASYPCPRCPYHVVGVVYAIDCGYRLVRD